MKPRHPVLRVGVLAVAAALGAFAATAAYLGAKAHAYRAERDNGTAAADGTVIEDGIGDAGDIRVRWVDRAGRSHVQRFGVYNTHRYAKGRRFRVAYDPADPRPEGFPAEPDESSAEDDLVVPIGIGGVLGGLVTLVWAVRGVLFRLAGRRPGRPMTAVALSGESATGAPLSLGTSTWLALAERDRPRAPTRWQRVMWHPAVDSGGGEVDVVVHGDPGTRGRVVPELPDGTRLVPVGRLRRGPPTAVLLTERSHLRADLADFFVLPERALPHHARPWWKPAVVFASAGAALGAVAGVLIGGAAAAVPFAVWTSALLVNAWALNGGEP